MELYDEIRKFTVGRTLAGSEWYSSPLWHRLYELIGVCVYLHEFHTYDTRSQTFRNPPNETLNKLQLKDTVQILQGVIVA